MSEWQEVKLGTIVESVSETFKFSGKQVIFLNTSDILADKFLHSDLSDPKTLPGQAKKRIKKGDLLFSEIRPANKRYALVNFDADDYVVSTKLMVLRSKGNIDPTYLKLFLTSDETLDYLQMIAEDRSGTFPQITFDILDKMDLMVPPLPEQKAIASVLSSLDDKIDLLHRQNTTLERMAEILFRHWFVEEAQECWEEKPLSSIANFLNGLACQKFPPTDAINNLPVLKIKELSSGISENSDWATSAVKPEYIVENGDVIFAWSASLMVKVWDGKKCVLNQHLFKVTSKEFPKWFYLHWCKHYLDEFISISSSHATTMGHIKRGDLDTAMVKVPKTHELEVMSEQMTPLLEKQITNSKQIKTLEKLRDTLVPKLMSGEIRIQNV
jgi:type I restriction enzyme S subunit